MFFKKIREKIRTIPDYIVSFRLCYGVRLYFRNTFPFPVFVRTRSGSLIFLGFDRVDDLILRDMNTSLSGAYFPPELTMKKGDNVLDVGAHHGIFAVEVSSRFSGVHVFSIEPDPVSRRYLNFNRLMNRARNIEVVNFALDAKSGAGFICKSEEGSWGNYVTDRASRNTVKIRSLAVSEFVENRQIRQVKYAKFNAEGAEFKVIPELFRLKIFPENLLLFADPEKGSVSKLLGLINDNSYGLINSNVDERRPWYFFSRIVKK